MRLEADGEGAFPMRLLHFRRTFVEKLFAIHARVELLKRNGSRSEPTNGQEMAAIRLAVSRR